MSLRAPSLSRREIVTALATSLAGALASSQLGATAADPNSLAEPLTVPNVMLEASHALPIPPRQDGAPGASQLFTELRGESLTAIEERLLSEVLRGNVPSFLRRLHPVSLTLGGEKSRIYALGDYLSVGSDHDYVRVPFSAPAAQRLAEAFGAVLPTPELVDAIHAAAREVPGEGLNATLGAGSWLEHAREHDRRIGEAIAEANVDPHELIAGHKKDVVVTPSLAQHPGRIAIYGFHRHGVPIQPLSTVHVVTYTDYSHGVRLLADLVEQRGERRSLREVMRDPATASSVSRTGAIDWPAYPDDWDTALIEARRGIR
jgi:hypothetical protein